MTTPSTFRNGAPPSLPRYEQYSTFERSGRSIALRYRAELINVLGALSGILSTICVLWGGSRFDLAFMAGPGVLFGVLVMLPWCRFCRISVWQTFATIVLSPIGYATAVYLTLTFSWLSLFAGLVGCGVMFLPLFLEPESRIRSALLIATVIGGVLGVAMPFFVWFGGFVLWQASVAYCLSAALQVEECLT